MLKLLKELFFGASGPASFTFIAIDELEIAQLLQPLESYLNSDDTIQQAYLAKVKYTRGGSSEIKPVLCIDSGHTILDLRRSFSQQEPELMHIFLHVLDVMVLADLTEEQINSLTQVGRPLRS